MDALIGSWKPEIFEKLNGWIAINSIKGEPSGDDAPFGPEVRRMLDLFLRDAEDMGFVVDDVDGYAGAAEMGAGDKTMGILVHLDIVPAGDGWTQDPFAGTLREGKYYGRGAQDDKGPAIAALYAMRAVKEAGIPLKHKVRLIAGCDEETGMSDMAYYRKVRPPVDYGFSPDAEYPLINIEKGGLGLLLSKACGGEEGAQIPVYSLNAGTRPNIVPGTATAELGTGGMGFSSLEEAVQAIEKAHPGYDLKLTDLGNGRGAAAGHRQAVPRGHARTGAERRRHAAHRPEGAECRGRRRGGDPGPGKAVGHRLHRGGAGHRPGGRIVRAPHLQPGHPAL